MNLITTLNYITDIAESLQLVNSAYKGSPYDHWNSSEIKYGSVCVAVENVSRDSLMTYNLVLYYADRLTQDRSNLYEVQTDATTILTSILNSLDEIGDVETPYNIELFDQQFSDYLAGGFVRFGLVIESPLGDCEMEDYEDIPDPYYIDKNGTYHLNGNYLLDVDVQSEQKLDMNRFSLYNGVIGQWVNEGDWNNLTHANNYFSYCTSDGTTDHIDMHIPDAVTECFWTFNVLPSDIKKLNISGMQGVTVANYFLDSTYVEEITLPENWSSFGRNTSSSIYQLFRYCRQIKRIDFPQFGDGTYTYAIYNLVYSAPKLETASLKDLSYCKSFNGVSYGGIFAFCTNLKNLTIEKLPDINLANTGFKNNTALSKESLVNILNALPNSTKGYSIDLGATNIAKLTDEETAIATNKGWTLI